MVYLNENSTIHVIILQAINFLDFLNSLWERRKFKEEAVNTECAKWFQLLLSMVDISKDHPDFLFSKFFTRCAVCKKHRKFIISQVCLYRLILTEPFLVQIYFLFNIIVPCFYRYMFLHFIFQNCVSVFRLCILLYKI